MIQEISYPALAERPPLDTAGPAAARRRIDRQIDAAGGNCIAAINSALCGQAHAVEALRALLVNHGPEEHKAALLHAERLVITYDDYGTIIPCQTRN